MPDDKRMIRVVLTTNLVVLFSIAAVNYAAAQLDCPGRHSSCSSTCRGKPPDFLAACEHNCWNDRNSCERTVERQKLDERVEEQRRLQEEQRRQDPTRGGSGYGSPEQSQWPNHRR